MITISSNTQKWRKWLLMEAIGLTPVGFRENEVKRYLSTEIDHVIRYLYKTFAAHQSANAQTDLLVVVKPIDSTAFGQFPNIRFRSLDELPFASREIRSHITPAACELWVCKTQLDYLPGTFAGRYLVHLHPVREEVIEIVWWESPRLLNSIAINDTPNPYLMSKRAAGQKVFRIGYFHPGIQRALTRDESEGCVQLLYQHLLRHETALTAFESLVESCNLSHYNIEFKFTRGFGVNIDWDTASDGHVLGTWYSKGIGC